MTTAGSVSEAALLDVISDIYAMAAAPSGISQTFDRIADFFGAKGLLIGPLTQPAPEKGPIVAYASAPFHEAVPDYLGHYISINPRKSWLSRNRYSDVVFTDLDFMDQGALRRHPFYAEFLMANDNLYCLDRLSMRHNGTKYWISAQYGAAADSPEHHTKSLFRLVTDHLLQSLDLLRLMISAPGEAASLVDRFDCPALALSASGRILHRNAEAETFADPRLSLAAGRMSARSSRDARCLDDLLARVGRPLTPGAARNIVGLNGDGIGPPLLIKASPLRQPDHDRNLPDFFDDIPRVLVLIHTPRPSAQCPVTQPLILLGLTSAEARVVELVASGLTAEAAAERLGVAPSTTRFQLRRAYDKLDVGKQSDLVHLVHRLARLGRP